MANTLINFKNKKALEEVGRWLKHYSDRKGKIVMAYTVTNFKNKKALKEAVKEYSDNHIGEPGSRSYYAIKCYQPGLGLDLSDYTGKVCLEGPHYPQAHSWYAEAELRNGAVVKVK